MKKVALILLMAVLMLTSCSESGTTESGAGDGTSGTAKPAIDVDLTALSSTMVYAEVNNMMQNPQSYVGKTVKLKGAYNASFFDQTQKYYHYVIISDATACCQQGLEFVWNGNHAYPADYPANGDEIEISGVFGSYEELGQMYYVIFTGSIS